jgi:hypothetical protein
MAAQTHVVVISARFLPLQDQAERERARAVPIARSCRRPEPVLGARPTLYQGIEGLDLGVPCESVDS